MTINEYKILETAIETYGKEHQIDKACEEMGELVSALMRFRCNRHEDAEFYFHKWLILRMNIIEEIADVEIMLKQLKMIFDADACDDIRAQKLRRLAKRLGIQK